jgi:hypothetical protein
LEFLFFTGYKKELLMKNKGGRPRKLTQEIKDALIEGIEKGLTLKAACKCAGISYASLANWRKFAKAENDEAELYTDLIRSINAAIRYAQYQQRQQALASIKKEDFKFRQPQKTKLSRKEKEAQRTNDAIARIRERIMTLEKMRGRTAEE